MKPAPTLIDTLFRASFRTDTIAGWKSNSEMRHALQSTRRFVVDKPMSAFMADLANESFLQDRYATKPGKGFIKSASPLNFRLADSLRVQSRLPHDAIWIEYNCRAYQHRSHELRGIAPPNDDELAETEGWLIQAFVSGHARCKRSAARAGGLRRAAQDTQNGRDAAQEEAAGGSYTGEYYGQGPCGTNSPDTTASGRNGARDQCVFD